MLAFCDVALYFRSLPVSRRCHPVPPPRWVMGRRVSSAEEPDPHCPSNSGQSTWSEVLDARPLSEIRVGGIVVPRHRWNRALRQAGVFRSVEYRVLKLESDSREILSTKELGPGESLDDVRATIRPLGRLLPRIERFCSWPVTVSVGHASLWSYKRDLALCFSVTLLCAISTLLFGILGPQYFSVFFIPSMSMFPTFDVGDAVLVKKMSVLQAHPHRGDVVFFRGPSVLLNMIQEAENAANAGFADSKRTNNGTSAHATTTPSSSKSVKSPIPVRGRDLFVKRIAAVPGDSVVISDSTVFVNGVPVAPAAPGSVDCPCQRIPAGSLYVLGDHPTTSLDSRYWGLLPEDNIVGTPVLRLWPPNRYSSLP